MVFVGPLLALLTLACQERTSRAEEGSDTTSDANSAAQGTSVDTQPGAPTSTDAATGGAPETGKAGASDSAAGTTPTQPQATGDDPTGEAGGGREADAGQGSGDVVNGWKQYEANCSRCHGQDALGSALAPDLRASVKGAVGHDAFVQVVTAGRPDKGMPAFAQQLDNKKVEDIYSYVTARSSEKLGPGRPGG